MKKRISQTKIVATIGPSSSSKDVLRDMFNEGIDVCRINFSHGSHEQHLTVVGRILELNEELNMNVAILADLQGPKLRIGEVENNIAMLTEGEEVNFLTREAFSGNAHNLYMSYQEFPRDVKVGDTILIDDGKIMLKVLNTNKIDNVKAKVVHGGIISSNKGVNLPDTRISLPSLTQKDLEDVHFAVDIGVDWIALSFVRSAKDIEQLKELIKQKEGHAGVIAKIEKPEAMEDIDNIIEAADGIMVARGDLGVEVSFSKVPMMQKNIVRKCIVKAKPVIIATQMMESMVSNFRPTRAEATDVANAVLDGVDALMLSGETSVGKYPIEVIRNMKGIIDWTEENGFTYDREHLPDVEGNTFLPDSICANACIMSSRANAGAIITFTNSGYTAFRISCHRPKADIFAFTNNTKLLRKLSLIWGVRAFFSDVYNQIDDATQFTVNFLKDHNLVHENKIAIHVGSTPLQLKGSTNMMKISYV